MTRRWLWDCDIDTTRPALARFAEAVIACGAQVVSSHRLATDLPMGRGVTAFLRVELAEGDEIRFLAICRPIAGEMRPPPRASVGTTAPPDDGHPGRRRDEEDPQCSTCGHVESDHKPQIDGTACGAPCHGGRRCYCRRGTPPFPPASAGGTLLAVVMLDHASFGAGVGTVVELSSDPGPVILKRYTDRDGARSDKLRIWLATPTMKVGDRVLAADLAGDIDRLLRGVRPRGTRT